MRPFNRLIFLALGALPWPCVAHAAGPEHIAVSLHAASAQPAPGRTVMLALKMVPGRGWHGYWSNPGDSGLPPSVRWSVPKGVTIGALRHPAPQILRVAGMTSFVHAGPHVLLASMRVPSTMRPGDALPIEGAVQFLACSDSLCVPQAATVTLRLTVGSGAPLPSDQSLFAAATRAIPPPAAQVGTYRREGDTVTFLVPEPPRVAPASATFFPFGEGVFERLSAQRLDDGRLRIDGRMTSAAPAALTGVVSDGRTSVQMRFNRVANALPTPVALRRIADAPEPMAARVAVAPAPTAASATPRTAHRVSAGAADRSPPWAIFGALLGGLLLSLSLWLFKRSSHKARLDFT